MTGGQGRISVIVPAYNAEKSIRRCVDSLRGQSYEDLEIIVVDDAGTDRTTEILSDLAAQDSRVKPVRAPLNLGVHGARRLGMGQATGDFIGFVDSDDYVERDMYSTLHDRLVETGASIAICAASCVVDGRAIGTKVAFRSSKLVRDDVLSNFCRLKFGSGVLWNKLYVRDVIESPALVELERAVDASEDYIVNFGAFSRAPSVALCPARLYNYVVHSTNASAERDPWLIFARLFRAYVVCLEVHSAKDRSCASLIDELYLKQLHFPGYRIGKETPTEAIRAHLAESLRRLATVNPESIYAIAQSLPKWEARVRKAIQLLRHT